MLPFCQWCWDQRVKTKRRIYCSNACKGKAYAVGKAVKIPPAAAALGRAKGVATNRAKFIAKMRREILSVVGEKRAFTLADVVAAVVHVNKWSYRRGWTACWQSQYRKQCRERVRRMRAA